MQPKLTRRQQEIMTLLVQGLTEREISLRFGKQVHGTIHNIYKRLGVNKRHEAVWLWEKMKNDN